MPCVRAFDFPATGLAPRMNDCVRRTSPFWGNMASIALDQHDRSCLSIVKGRIKTQVVRVRMSRPRTDNRQRVQHQREHRPLVHIGCRAHHAQWHPASIDQQMLFIAGFGAVGRIGPGLFFPPGGRARMSHRPPATPTQCRACHHTDGDTAPKSAQTLPRASTRQTDHRLFARAHRLHVARRATDSPSTRPAASHRAMCDRWRGGAHLWHARAAPVREVRVRSTAHRGLDVGLTWPHIISSCGLQTRS